MKNYSSLSMRLENNSLKVILQTRLPHEEVWCDATHPRDLIPLIKKLDVRGAPLIGVAAALSLGFSAGRMDWSEFSTWAEKLAEARPTAVNLKAAVDRVMLAAQDGHGEWQSLVAHEAEKFLHEDVDLCNRLANRGAALIKDGEGILTHCNAGALATAGVGTALGVICRAHEQGKRIHVYVDETRPLLQGARLTAWELEKLKIPYTLICDNMAAALMQSGKVQRIFTGADRIAANGDSANKIGTYGVAVLAKYHNIPFYIVAPRTTVDEKCATGAGIPIEEREADEVRAGKSPTNAKVWNPAFDVTPRALISELIVE